MYNAILLAGDQNNSPLKKEWPFNKALLQIHNKPMINYVVDVLNTVEEVDKIVVVGPKTELQKKIGDKVSGIIDGSGSIFQNIILALSYLGKNKKTLVLTCDIPMITKEAIQDFLLQTKKIEADFYYPIISREDNDKRYPGVKRTYVRLKDGTYTGGNIFLFNPNVIERFAGVAEEVLENRKKPWRLVKILGWSFMIKFFLGNLVISELEKRVSDLFDIKARAIISHYPEIGTDVDKPSDLKVATKFLSLNN